MLERVGLSPRAVESQHQLCASPLAQRLRPDKRLELGHELGVAAEGEVGFDPILQGGKPQLLEPGDLGLRELLVPEVRERRSAPDRKRNAQRLGSSARLALLDCLPSLPDERLEAPGVEVGRLDVKNVALPARLEAGSSQSLAELRDVDLDALDRLRRRPTVPELLDQTLDLVGAPVAVATGAGAVWVVDAIDGTVLRLDPLSGARRSIRVGSGPSDVAVGAGGVWVANALDGTVSRLDPATGNPVGDAIALRFEPARLAVGGGAVWVTGTLSDEVARIDPSSNAVAATIAAGDGPTGIAVGLGSIWVADSLAHAVVRIAPASGRVLATIGVGASPDSVAVADGAVWVSVRAA